MKQFPHKLFGLSCKLSTDEEFNTAVERSYYINKDEIENELLDDEDSFDDTFSEKSCDIEFDEVDNADFDELLNDELKVNLKSVDYKGDFTNAEIATPVKSAALTLKGLSEQQNIEAQTTIAKSNNNDSDEMKTWEKDHSIGRSDQSTMH